MSKSSSKLVYVSYSASADPAVRKSFQASAEKFSRMCVKVFTHVRKSFHACVEKFSRNCEKVFTQVPKLKVGLTL